MPTHETLEGRTLTYELTSEQAAFLARVQQAVADPSVREDDLIALIYGPENPLLDHAMLPGRAMVTKAVFDNPLYHVLADYIGRKRVQTGSLDLEAAKALFTMTVTQAAEKLGVHVSAVHQAIQAWRLAAWKKDGQLFLNPENVEHFGETRRDVPRRGPSPQLRLRTGSVDGVTFRVKHPGELEHPQSPERHVTEGTLTSWKKVGVLLGNSEGKFRFFELAPGGEDNEVKHGHFYLRGRFTIERKINNPRQAREAFESFEAE